jgi:hypothetical protein
MRNSDSSMAFSSWMTRVRVDKLSRGSAHSQFALFFGKLDTLFLELAHWWWPKVALFFAYLAYLGRKWISTQMALKRSIPDKWRNEIPPSTSPSRRKRFSFGCHP